MARVLAGARFSANALTITGAAIGLGAAFFITQAHYPAALACVVLNRLFDGLDGAIARINGPTDFGGYLDSGNRAVPAVKKAVQNHLFDGLDG
eukprot:gene67668-92682_t